MTFDNSALFGIISKGSVFMVDELDKEDPIEAIKRRNEERARRLRESLRYGDFGLAEEKKSEGEAVLEDLGVPLGEPAVSEVAPLPIPDDSLVDHIPEEVEPTPVGEEELVVPEIPPIRDEGIPVFEEVGVGEDVGEVPPPPPVEDIGAEIPPPPPGVAAEERAPVVFPEELPAAPPVGEVPAEGVPVTAEGEEEGFGLPSLEELGLEGLAPSAWEEKALAEVVEPKVEEPKTEPEEILAEVGIGRHVEPAPAKEATPIEVEGPKIEGIPPVAEEAPAKEAPPVEERPEEVVVEKVEEELRQLVIEIRGNKVKVGRKNLTMPDAIDLLSIIVEKYRKK